MLELFLFPHQQPYNTQPTAPRLKHRLLHRYECETTEGSAACEEIVSTNLLKYKDIYI